MIDLVQGAAKTSAAGKEFTARHGHIRKGIGANISRVRRDQRLSLAKLSRKTGLAAEKLDHWELGRMDIDLAAITRIAAALRVPHTVLLNVKMFIPQGGKSGKNGPPHPTPLPQGEREGPVERQGEGESGTDSEADAEEKEEKSAHAYHEDFEVEIYNAVKWRLGNPEGLPGEETIFAMEEPVYRMMDASTLFCDLAFGIRDNGPPKSRGLVFLAKSMRRETTRLYQLLTGCQPNRFS